MRDELLQFIKENLFTIVILLLLTLTIGNQVFGQDIKGNIFTRTTKYFTADFYLKTNDQGNIEPYYFDLVPKSMIEVSQEIGYSNIIDMGTLITVDGDVRIHHKEGLVDLVQRPEVIRSFRTSTRWTAKEKAKGSDTAWKIIADEGSVLEIFYNIDGAKNEELEIPLYLAPGFKGKVHLDKGESANIFGKTYNAASGQTLELTWENVEIIPDPHGVPIILLMIGGILFLIVVFLLNLYIKKKYSLNN